MPVIYRHCGNDYLGFDIGLICHGLGLGLGLGLELCGLVNITDNNQSPSKGSTDIGLFCLS